MGRREGAISFATLSSQNHGQGESVRVAEWLLSALSELHTVKKKMLLAAQRPPESSSIAVEYLRKQWKP